MAGGTSFVSHHTARCRQPPHPFTRFSAARARAASGPRLGCGGCGELPLRQDGIRRRTPSAPPPCQEHLHAVSVQALALAEHLHAHSPRAVPASPRHRVRLARRVRPPRSAISPPAPARPGWLRPGHTHALRQPPPHPLRIRVRCASLGLCGPSRCACPPARPAGPSPSPGPPGSRLPPPPPPPGPLPAPAPSAARTAAAAPSKQPPPSVCAGAARRLRAHRLSAHSRFASAHPTRTHVPCPRPPPPQPTNLTPCCPAPARRGTALRRLKTAWPGPRLRSFPAPGPTHAPHRHRATPATQPFAGMDPASAPCALTPCAEPPREHAPPRRPARTRATSRSRHSRPRPRPHSCAGWRGGCGRQAAVTLDAGPPPRATIILPLKKHQLPVRKSCWQEQGYEHAWGDLRGWRLWAAETSQVHRMTMTLMLSLPPLSRADCISRCDMTCASGSACTRSTAS